MPRAIPWPWLTVGSLASSHPRPDPRSASAAPAPIANRSSPVGSRLARAQVFDHLVSGKSSCERTLQNCTFSPLHGSAQFLARSFHVKAQGGETKIQADNTRLQHNNVSHVIGVEAPICLKGKENECLKVTAFSPLEVAHTQSRKSGLVNESLKVKSTELSIKITYALIPALLLVSKSKLTTSVLVLCICWQVYGFFKEIFLDYVHHEVTRKWVLIYFKLLVFILAKDTILAFDLV
ncbi:hypothetical protein MUK42_24853 [Musa troglodytarum]|uniref:Succinate dehydrogenase subunit 4, mitochondrial n=1 Tax=Musa troglodytarum TaxID=320322 RepID=A0A9E7EAF6_9LILI|nr:hypothetical protein MUK42_24853 [Musa troglodytarum]